MWLRLTTTMLLLALAGRTSARPRDPDPLPDSPAPEVPVPVTTSVPVSSEAPAPAPAAAAPDSGTSTNRDLKDLQHIDQSLRTVATQLLNTSSSRDSLLRSKPQEKHALPEIPMQIVQISTNSKFDEEDDVKTTPAEITKMKFGIPVNSKFGQFEITNPGQAMAITEEEMEKELASATTEKSSSTTAGMLSTWIQLYPPSTTQKPKEEPKSTATTSTRQPSTIKTTKPSEIKHYTTTEKNPSTPGNFDSVSETVKTSENTPKVKTTPPSTVVKNQLNVLSEVPETKIPDATSTVSSPTMVKLPQQYKKPAVVSNSGSKPKTTTPKTPVSKPPKIHTPHNRTKTGTKRPHVTKNETNAATSKIEKVTMRPIATTSSTTTATPPSTTTTTLEAEKTERPMFVTKLKASVVQEAQKNTATTATPPSSTMKPISAILAKPNSSNSESSGTTSTKFPYSTRLSGHFKINHKRPIDEETKIEIEPISVSPPVLTIQKLSDDSAEKDDQASEVDTKLIKVKPEVSLIEISQPTSSSTSSTQSLVSTTSTKRPRTTKRKKNKNRRRKPSSTTSLPSSSSSSAVTSSSGSTDVTQASGATTEKPALNQSSELQESKIEPESKISVGGSKKSKKKKQQIGNNQVAVQKPIGTQIYNFLSREVMPSVGVMSLVGLGLGLASYFLYPFGAVITRRNYEIEPKYKYTTERYGEGELPAAAYKPGASTPPPKYPGSNKENFDKKDTYYRFGSDMSRYPALTTTNNNKYQPNRVIYRPVGSANSGPTYDLNYRNPEYKYSGVDVSTPNYYHVESDAAAASSTPASFYPSDTDTSSSTSGYYNPVNDHLLMSSSTPASYYHREVDAPVITSTPATYYQQHRDAADSMPSTSTPGNYYHHHRPEPDVIVSTTPSGGNGYYNREAADVSTTADYYQMEADTAGNINYYRRDSDASGTVNREFVVGSVPKQVAANYAPASEMEKRSDFFSLPDTYEPEGAAAAKMIEPQESAVDMLPAAATHSLGKVETVEHHRNHQPVQQESMDDEGDDQQPVMYDDIQVAPHLMEHGPRFLGGRSLKRSKRAVEMKVSEMMNDGNEFSTDTLLDNEIHDEQNEILRPADYMIDRDGPTNGKLTSEKVTTYSSSSSAMPEVVDSLTIIKTTMTESPPLDSSSSSSTVIQRTMTTQASLQDLSDVSLDNNDDDLQQNHQQQQQQNNNSGNFNTPGIPTIPDRPGSKFDFFGLARRVAEMKIQIGLTFLKKASENFARYIGRVQQKLHFNN